MPAKAPRAFLLAAGLGTRLRPLTEVLPKPMIPIGNIPLVLFSLAQLRKAGIREIGINLHHLPEAIPDFLGDGSKLGLSIHYFHETKLLGTGGALRNAREFLQDDDFVLMNGDTLLHVDLPALMQTHREGSQFASLVLTRSANPKRFGGLSFDSQKNLRGLVDRSESPPSPLQIAVYAGAGMFNPSILSLLEGEGETPCLVRQGILKGLAQGQNGKAFLSDSYFADVGSPGHYLDANLDLFSNRTLRAMFESAKELYSRLGLPEIRFNEHNQTCLQGEIAIGQDARLEYGVAVGDRVRIGKQASIQSSVIWKGTTIPDSIEMKNSIAFRGNERVQVPARGQRED